MSIKYIPFIPEPIEGQAVLGNFNLSLKYKGADDTSTVLQRGMPLYEVEKQETVGGNADGEWHSDGEVKIDKLGRVIRNSEKTKVFWDGTVRCDKRPLRLKVRNICGDETEWVLQ